MNLNYHKAHDLKTRASTSWPKAASTETELKLLIMSHNIKKKMDEMLEKHKSQKISLEHTNLTQQNIDGLKELNDRKDLRVVLTDKSKKMLILTNETYQSMINVYTTDAKQIDEDELKNRENLNNGHTRSLMRIFRIGCDNNYDTFTSDNSAKIQAIKESLLSSNQAGAKLDVYGKDHKQFNPDGSLERAIRLKSRGLYVLLIDFNVIL